MLQKKKVQFVPLFKQKKKNQDFLKNIIPFSLLPGSRCVYTEGII